MPTVEEFLAEARHAKEVKGFRSQFAEPHGLLGRLAGFLLAATSKKRSLAVLALLNLQPDDRVLEIGFGPGMDIQRVSGLVAFTAGIDSAEVMLRQARKRNAAAIRAGRVELRQASMDEPLPFADESFTTIFSINSLMFWQRPLEALGELRRVLRPGGTLAIAVQPIRRDADDDLVSATGTWLANALIASSFTDIRVEIADTRPIKTAVTLATK